MGLPTARFGMRPIMGAAVETIGVLGAFPVTMQDYLVVRARSAASGPLTVSARVLSPSGELEFITRTITLPTDRSVSTTLVQLVAGWLASVHASIPSGLARGAIYASIGIQTGSIFDYPSHSVTLVRGYLSSNEPLSYPPGQLESNTAGHGFLRTIDVTQPAVGANWTQTVPTGALWRVRAIRFQLNTGATAATRLVRIRYVFNADHIFRAAAPGTQVASQNGFYFAFDRGASEAITEPTGGLMRYIPIPVLDLGDGEAIDTTTDNIQGDDQFTNVRLFVEEFLEDLYS